MLMLAVKQEKANQIFAKYEYMLDDTDFWKQTVVLVGHGVGEMEEETYELWGERHILVRQYSPSRERDNTSNDMLIVPVIQKETYQMLAEDQCMLDTDFLE